MFSPARPHHQRPCWYDSYRFSTSFSAVRVRSKWWHRLGCGFISHDHHDADPWWSRAWRKLRAWSSVVVTVPTWKKLIRRCKGDRNNCGKNFNDFHYNPLDYAKNFDDGPGHDRYFDEDGIGRDFSSRFVSTSTSCAERADHLYT